LIQPLHTHTENVLVDQAVSLLQILLVQTITAALSGADTGQVLREGYWGAVGYCTVVAIPVDVYTTWLIPEGWVALTSVVSQLLLSTILSHWTFRTVDPTLLSTNDPESLPPGDTDGTSPAPASPNSSPNLTVSLDPPVRPPSYLLVTVTAPSSEGDPIR